MLVIVTGADHIRQETAISRRERYIEYMLSLTRIFSYNLPVAAVLSESRPTVDSPPFDKFPFITLKTIPTGELDRYNKSQKEFLSIKLLLTELAEKHIPDDTFIIKSSGRYLLSDDSFFSIVRENKDKPIDAIMRLCDNNRQMYTFLFAMRYRHFKEFYAQDISILNNNKNIERATLEYLIHKGLLAKSLCVDRLGMLANINNENRFIVF